MSRRGNCWDNAPQESFFGHFKDEALNKECTTLEELKREIKRYMTYYNHYRYQWNLKKMIPVQY
jgi:putative transposase